MPDYLGMGHNSKGLKASIRQARRTGLDPAKQGIRANLYDRVLVPYKKSYSIDTEGHRESIRQAEQPSNGPTKLGQDGDQPDPTIG